MITILADDLSGALDTAVVFQVRGASTLVRPDGHWEDGPWEQAVDVVAWNLNDRHAPTTDGRVQQVERLMGSERVYMKVDSTLRGPVGAQIDAVLQGALRYQSALVCPAFPENGRTVIGGRLYVDGQPLEHSALVQDPENPMVSGDIAAILRRTSALPVKTVPLEHLSGLDHPTGIIVVDAKTANDLDYAARYLEAHPEVLPVGSAGLARALGALWVTRPVASRTPDALGPVDQVIALVGSLHPTTRGQVARAQTSGSWEVRTPSSGTDRIPDAPLLILTTSMNRIDHASVALETMVQDAATYVKAQLGQGRLLAVVATGGDTALAFLRHLAVKTLWPQQELAPGVVWSVAQVGSQRISLITKSGAFGGPDFFELIQDVIWGESSGPQKRSVTS